MSYPRSCTGSLRTAASLALLLGAISSSVYAAEPSVSVGPIDVVLDAGHGGSNTGSPGRGEVLEKRVTLAIVKAVRRRLLAAGVSVQLTRATDLYVPIRARARMANALSPRCFVSIHTNASVDHAHRGIETYALSREAVDIRARHAAAIASSDVDGVLDDLRAVATARASLRLAEAVQHQLLGGGSSRADGSSYFPVDRGVRQAAHDVLADAEVPAILVEAGFLDHPVEGRVLASAAGQAEIATRIAAGIMSYLAGGDVPVPPRRAELAEPPPTARYARASDSAR